MSHEDILVARRDATVEITINRPEKLNSLREQTAAEILEVLAEAEFDRKVRAVVLAGSEKAFCTGIDTSEFQIKENEYFEFYRFRKRARKVNRLFQEVAAFTKPVIVAVEGFALGGGLELALTADIVVAGGKAKFGLPECKLGLMPGGGGTQTLPRLIGPQLAKDLIWTGRRIDAAEAERLRLVTYVTEAGAALAKAHEVAAAVAANAPLSVMFSKAAIDRGADMPLAEGFATEADLSFYLYFSRDRNEGLAAFREKRAPNFQGE
ncbi:enoyl-CoA hydratase/isomerase family protein [Xanthobacter sp. KR7-225]|uniref:enoyl-CoA hydratase/isomerase family protein n=1 Tax=Xanthobacter sp. KR7-225 TaxID=3156613 RepID=UPI0032B58539